MPRVDYDLIAHLYDEPLRDYVADPNLLVFLEERRLIRRAEVRVLAYALDRQHFVSVERFLELMTDAGFVNVRVSSRDSSRDERLQDFLAYAADRHRASQFMAISDASYSAGIDRLTKTIAQGGLQPSVEKSEFFVVTIGGEKP